MAIFILIMSLFGSSCYNQAESVFLIRYDSVRSLKESSYVYFRGSPIGKVTDLTILPNWKILVEIEIDQTLEPTRNDQFALVNLDFIGTQVIEIFPGVSGGDSYTRKDTITGTVMDRSRSRTPDSLTPLDSAERRVLYDSLIAPHIKKDQ